MRYVESMWPKPNYFKQGKTVCKIAVILTILENSHFHAFLCIIMLPGDPGMTQKTPKAQYTV